MKLEGIIPLYKSMKDQDIGRYKFRYQHNHLIFECLFFIDVDPFEIVMGCIGHNFAIFLEMEKGFQIKPFVEPKETFFALLKALKTNNESFNKFEPLAFFKELNTNIPNHANPENKVTASDVVRYYSNIEESDKIYFCGWLDNTKQGNNVSEDNLTKTKRMLGQRAYEFSRRRKQSTRWTHERSKAIEFALPD